MSGDGMSAKDILNYIYFVIINPVTGYIELNTKLKPFIFV